MIYFKKVINYIIYAIIILDILHAQYGKRNAISFSSWAVIRINHTDISSSELRKLLIKDGAEKFIGNFSNKAFVYRFTLQGGGGYYTSSLIKIILNKKPSIVIGKGWSDDNALYRVSIGDDSTQMYGFNSRGWTNLTGKWLSKSVYVLLDSKWGTNYDTELTLWLAFDSPLDSVIRYKLIRYKDSFRKFYVKSYQVFLNPKNIHVMTSLQSLHNALKNDDAEEYIKNLNRGYTYRIEITGGGGYYSDCLLKLNIEGKVKFAIARGFSDANDNILRTGLGKEVNHLVDVKNPYWTNVTHQIGRYFDVRLNSKWGTDNDSKIIIWLSSSREINGFNYSIAMFPSGFGTIKIEKYLLQNRNTLRNSLNLYREGVVNLDQNPHSDFITTTITPDGWLHVSVIFNGEGTTFSQSLKYWDFRHEKYDSVYIQKNTLIIQILDLVYTVDNIHFIKPDINVNRYVGVIEQTAGAGQFYGEKIHVLYWDGEKHRFSLRLFEGEGEIKQTFYPKWEIRVLSPLNWYSFLSRSKQLYLPHYYTWSWDRYNLVNNSSAHSEEYRSLLNRLYKYLEIARENGNRRDVKEIQDDIEKVLQVMK